MTSMYFVMTKNGLFSICRVNSLSAVRVRERERREAIIESVNCLFSDDVIVGYVDVGLHKRIDAFSATQTYIGNIT